MSTRGSRTIRSGRIPIFSQAATATWSSSSPSSGSPAKTVTQTRSRSSLIRSNMNSQASSTAPSLKYCPNEKLPSISKKVSVLSFMPTSSMSGVRKTFCTVASSGAGGSSKPRKYGISGCIPAEMSSVERSSARGISECEGLNSWPLDSKNSRKPARSSAVVRMAAILRAVDSGTDRWIDAGGTRLQVRTWGEDAGRNALYWHGVGLPRAAVQAHALAGLVPALLAALELERIAFRPASRGITSHLRAAPRR